MMNDSYHIYFKGEILFKNLSKDEFEFVWGKLYTSYINALNKELTYELISENNIMESTLFWMKLFRFIHGQVYSFGIQQ